MLVAQLCLTLCDPVDCSWPSSSVHGNLQARILKWVAIPFSRGSSSQLRGRTWVSCIIRRLYYLSHQGSPSIDCIHLKVSVLPEYYTFNDVFHIFMELLSSCLWLHSVSV